MQRRERGECRSAGGAVGIGAARAASAPTVSFARARARTARAIRPLCMRWPLRMGRKSLVRHLTPTAGQIPCGEPARMRPGFWVRVREDPLFRRIWLFGEFEPVESRFFRRLLRRGDGVIDAGANFGWHTLVCARAVGTAGWVIAVEPIPETMGLLRDNVALNGFDDRVSVVPVALGDRCGDVTVFTYAKGSLAEASFADAGRADAVAHRCPLTTLDALFEASGCPMPVLVKVDVEGFEFDVLWGAPRLLTAPDAPVVTFEVSRGFLARRGMRPDAIHALLRGMGYSEFWRFGRRRGLSPVGALEWAGGADLNNFVASKSNHAGRVRLAR